MKITDFKKYLQSLSKEEMEAELLNLVKSYKDVKEYFSLKVNPENEEEVFLKYKENIKNQFFTKKFYGNPNFREIRGYYTSFKKISKNIENLLELMMYTVELAMRYLDELGDSEERFYDSTCKIFEDLCKMIIKSNFEEKYIGRCRKIVESSYDKGYGLYDIMSQDFYHYFGVELD
jgi:hypothetical protein